MRVYERKHAHLGGSIVARVTVDRLYPATYEVMARLLPPDGRELHVRISEETCSYYPTLSAAQEAADEHVSRFMGHECSADCGPWQSPVTH